MWEGFGRGLVIGILLSAPLGPVAVLAIRRGLERGWAPAAVTGLGAAVSDTFYSALSLYAAARLLETLAHWHRPIYLAAALVLLAAVILTLRQRIDIAPGAPVNPALPRMALDGLLIALLNPANILGVSSTVVTFAGLAPSPDAPATLAGIALAAGLWWTGLALAAARFRHRIGNRFANALNRIVAGLLAVAAIYAAWQGLR